VLVLAPRRSVAAEFISDLTPLGRVDHVTVELADSALCLRRPRNRTIRVVVASQLFSALSRAGHTASHSLASLRLVVCENLEQIDSSYELSVSLLRHATRRASTRFVGFSASLNDAEDLASWLGVEPMGLHSFRPSDRDQALSASTQTFTIPPSAALFKVMAKPAHAAIQAGESAIVFVPSSNQCRTVALNLLTQCALEMENAKGYLPYETSDDRLEYHLARLQDRNGLVDFISRGIGFFHEAIHKSDRRLMLEMYAEGTIKVLVVPRDSCWTLPVRAAVVVVMGTQYMCVKAEGSERQLRDYSLTELVRMQGRAVRHSAAGQFLLFCQAETKDTFTRFLGEGLPLESKLLETPELGAWYTERRKAGDIADKLEAVEALSFTFLARRVGSNPSYYDASDERNETLSRIVDRFEDIAES
jgi:antiviral helicase SLH1